MFFQNIKSAVFIGAHTDDEMVAAGTLRKLVKAGTNVQIFAFSCATIPGKGENYTTDTLSAEFNNSMRHIGVKNNTVYYFDQRNLSEQKKAVRQAVYDIIEKVKPDLAFILSGRDNHQDHAVLGRVCEIVMRNRVPNIIRCHFPWNFVQGKYNLFVPLEEDELDAKLRVIRAYQSQMFRYDFEGIFMTQAKLNGLITKGKPAEAFEVVRLTTGGGK